MGFFRSIGKAFSKAGRSIGKATSQAALATIRGLASNPFVAQTALAGAGGYALYRKLKTPIESVARTSQRFKETAENILSQGGSVIGKGIDKTKEGFRAFGQAVSETAETVQDTAIAARQGVRNAVFETAKALENTLGDAVVAVEDAVPLDRVVTAGDDLVEGLSRFGVDVSEGISNISNDVIRAGQFAAEGFEEIGGSLANIGEQVGEFTTAAADAVLSNEEAIAFWEALEGAAPVIEEVGGVALEGASFL